MTCRNPALADDLMQETYLRMLRRPLHELDAAQRKAYLFKAAHSAFVDYLRAHRREVRWAEQQVYPDATDAADFDAVVARECRPGQSPVDLPIDVQRVFDTLKARQQTLLWLAYVEGFNHEEIAEVIGVNARSVRVLLSRARAELAARLTDRGLAPGVERGARR